MKLRKGLWLLVVALVVLVGFLAPSVPAAGQKLVVRVSEPFEVSGQLYPAGELSLRELQAYSPVATLNEIRVDGKSLGVVLARDQANPARATRDEVIFERSERGHLVLASVALKGHPVRKLYRLGQGDDSGTWQAVSQPQPAMLASAK
jgi:hypothetical protein